jgi:uncharacterized membrane protein
MNRPIKRALWWQLLFLALVNSLLAMRYLLPHVPFPAKLPNVKSHKFFLAIHASSGAIALLVGPFQFVESFRLRRRMLHRRMGWVYAAAVLVGAIFAIPLALHANFGPIAGSGFFTMDILWLVATAIALRMAIRHRFQDHRRWMLRSYSLTAAAITLRILLPASAIFKLPVGPSYRAIAWMCWATNLLGVEVYLRLQQKPSLRLRVEHG